MQVLEINGIHFRTRFSNRWDPYKEKQKLKKPTKPAVVSTILRAKTKIEPLKGGKQQIVISEIPYEVNKNNASEEDG